MTDHENVGYMAWGEFARFRRAVHFSLELVPWLRVAGYVKTGEPDEIRAPSSDHPLGVPPTWLAAEEITRLSHQLQGWPDLEDVANDSDGVEIARVFTREVETAAHRWPFEDRSHRVRYLRCQECSGETLRYSPPRFTGDDVRIGCTECDATVTEEEFNTLAALVALEMKRAGDDSRRLGAA
ncbi:hypothetical protein [Microbacterium sp. KNMS]